MAICSHRDKTKLKRAKEQRTEERKKIKNKKKTGESRGGPTGLDHPDRERGAGIQENGTYREETFS